MSNFTSDNLIAYEGTLKPGQRLLRRLDGTFLPIGAGSAGGSSMDFYKCTSVSSDSSMTWTGRKAVLNEGVYSFESNSTEGLSYGTVVPIIGNTYTRDCLTRIILYAQDASFSYLRLQIDAVRSNSQGVQLSDFTLIQNNN